MTAATPGCSAGCGRCCDPVVLGFGVESMSGPSAPFAREHWTEFAAVGDDRPGHEGETLHLVRCAKFDPHSRMCTAYDTRPPICSGFPYYGRGVAELHSTFSLPPGCGHLAEHYRMLPIVSLR